MWPSRSKAPWVDLMSGGGNLGFHGEMAIGNAQMGQYDKDSAYKVAALALVLLALLSATVCGSIAAWLGLSDYYGWVMGALQLLTLSVSAAIIPILKRRAQKKHEAEERTKRALLDAERQRQADAFMEGQN